MKVEPGQYGLPTALLQHIVWSSQNKQRTPEIKPLPTLPVVIESEFFVYEVKTGPVMKVQMSLNIGRLIASA